MKIEQAREAIGRASWFVCDGVQTFAFTPLSVAQWDTSEVIGYDHVRGRLRSLRLEQLSRVDPVQLMEVPAHKIVEELLYVSTAVTRARDRFVWECGVIDATAHNLREQDNLCTAEPIFVVEQKERIWGIDSEYSDDFVWRHTEDWEYSYTEDEIQDAIREDLATLANTGDVDSIPEAKRDPEDRNYERSYYVERWKYVTAHFTRAAAEQYIAQNAHNLTEPRVFVHSQYRCPEYIAVRKALMAAGGEP